ARRARAAAGRRPLSRRPPPRAERRARAGAAVRVLRGRDLGAGRVRAGERAGDHQREGGVRLRAATVGAAFAVGYLGCWFLLLLAAPPMPWLVPESGQWVFAARPDGVAADYYGRVLYSLL